MTDLSISLTGIHARHESTIQATQDWERGRIDDAALQKFFRSDGDALVDLQRRVGAEYVTDGQITLAWQDIFRPISTGFRGVKAGAMVRWFNTNTFYFTPTVTGEISTDGRALSRAIETRFLTGNGTHFKVILPDPLTFGELSEDGHYHSMEKLIFAYADALNEELRSLKGVDYVQFSSPSLVAGFGAKPISSAELGQLGEAIRGAIQGTSIRTGFHTFFGDASPYLPSLLDAIPTDDIGFDLTQTDVSSLVPTKKGVIAGLVDSRSTYLESTAELASRVEQIAERTGTGSITLSPSADLRYIPRASADKKVELLGALRAEMRKQKERK